MITWEPKKNQGMFVNGQKISSDQEMARKYIIYEKILFLITILVCDTEVAEFKCRFRLCFSAIPDSPWNNFVARCILIIWELCMLCTYHQPRLNANGCLSPVLKLTQFRMTGKITN